LVEKAAHKTKTTKAKVKKMENGACPTFFIAACMTATAGGSGGYESASFELTRHLLAQCPYDMEDDEWETRCRELEDQVHNWATDDEVITWFQKNLPRCIEMVPKRRHDSFVAGVRSYIEENDI
jgi:hypothetical protein